MENCVGFSRETREIFSHSAFLTDETPDLLGFFNMASVLLKK
jgi:hypothetical protein